MPERKSNQNGPDEKERTATAKEGQPKSRAKRGGGAGGASRGKQTKSPAQKVTPVETAQEHTQPAEKKTVKKTAAQSGNAPKARKKTVNAQPGSGTAKEGFKGAEVKREPASVKQAPIPAKQAPTPAKQAPTPAKREPAAAKQEPAAAKQQNRGRRSPARTRSAGKKPTVRMIPLGGLGEVGKNITVYECQGDSFILDCGVAFPDDGMPGVDLVIPDFTYVLENKNRIKGIVITHGHEDHIGSLPFLLKQAKFPIYGTKLTLGLVEGKLKEHGLLGKVQLNVIKPGDVVHLGCMSVEAINVNHSIPDALAYAVTTPVGTIVQTGDFKIDFTPIRGEIINLARLGELGSQGVLALLSDSTNAERTGSTMSERTVGESFDKLFGQYQKSRIIVATFASNVHRVQQIVDAAVKYKRKVAVSGRSMENVVSKALEIGYLDIPSGVLVDVDAVSKYPPEKMVIITTGSQGEPMSALSRMAMGDHRKLTVTPEDCIIISASPIPGNEKTVTKVINELLKLGAAVVYERMFEIHVSGHACQDELKMMMAMTKPKFMVPMHGEVKHLKKHAELAVSMGIPRENVFVGDIGKVLETDGERMWFSGSVQAGKVLVDGLGVGDVGSIVLRDRKHLAEDGLIVVVASINAKTRKLMSGPDIVSRGFVYVRENEDMIGRTKDIARASIQKCIDSNTREWGVIKQKVRDDVGDYLWQKTKRNPMILPVIQEI